jgi:GMP synthase-like glutamine amidotransferase
MHVGILNMYSHKLQHYLPSALDSIGCSYTIVDFDENHAETIRRSRITRWILTGSDHNVMNKTTPQLDPALLKMHGKRFMMVCYSMESILFQLGCHLITRRNNVQEYFDLDLGGTTIKAFRNHYAYIVPDSLTRGMRLLATYKGDTMIVRYKNTLMTQWHPERTADGIRFMKEWTTERSK